MKSIPAGRSDLNWWREWRATAGAHWFQAVRAEQRFWAKYDYWMRRPLGKEASSLPVIAVMVRRPTVAPAAMVNRAVSVVGFTTVMLVMVMPEPAVSCVWPFWKLVF